jgi:putative PIG3 family NAD(P)H quinone oxidoreductase
VKALVITRPGGPEVLAVLDRPKPEPRGDEILVRVLAAGVNRADLLQREGHYPAPAGSPQDIPGMEYAGVIEALGPDVRSRTIGQRVFGLVGGGAQAEYLVTRERLSMLVPEGIADVDAGAVPEAYITAHDALYVQGALAQGERVLVHAAGSGVGLAALQLAKARGCTVYGTSRTPAKLERAKALGLDFAIDPAAKPFDEIATDIDVVIDFVGAPYFEQNMKVLRTRGRLIVVSTLGGTAASLSLRTLMTKRLRINGTVLRSRSYEEKIEATRAFERDVIPLFAKRSIRVPIDRVFTLGDAAAAHRFVASDANFGKVVFSFARA